MCRVAMSNCPNKKIRTKEGLIYPRELERVEPRFFVISVDDWNFPDKQSRYPIKPRVEGGGDIF